MTTSAIYRWRKTSDINREHALFELVEGDLTLLNVGFTDEGNFEVAFDPRIAGKIFECELLLKLLEDGRVLAEQDR